MISACLDQIFLVALKYVFILKILSASFGILSAIFIFCFGVPKVTLSEGTSSLLIEGPDEDKERIKGSKKVKRYICLSKVGVLILFLSFVLQIIIVISER
ncbi:MAG: hypothetical protein JXR90_11115 [Spirochaetes bacterium]|nr:hypothetical protein [Spirochaetota bacterium]